MKITQIRENGDTEALSVVNIDLLIEKMKRETKLRPVSELRQALLCLPDEPCSLTSKLPRVIPAAAFGRVNGVRQMKNLQWDCRTDRRSVSRKNRSGDCEAKGCRTSSDNAGFHGSKRQKCQDRTCFTRPDGTLPQTTEEAEVFQAHAYRLAIKCYQPQLPFNILLKEPKLEQFSTS